jgi:hypothetical protein
MVIRKGVAGMLVGTLVVGGVTPVVYCWEGQVCKREDADQPHTHNEGEPTNTAYRIVANTASSSSVAVNVGRPFSYGETK